MSKLEPPPAIHGSGSARAAANCATVKVESINITAQFAWCAAGHADICAAMIDSGSTPIMNITRTGDVVIFSTEVCAFNYSVRGWRGNTICTRAQHVFVFRRNPKILSFSWGAIEIASVPALSAFNSPGRCRVGIQSPH